MKHLLIPSHYKHFRCIADKCENHCCQEWGIGIDKETYKLYKSKSLLLDKEGIRVVTLKEKPEGLLDFAFIKLKEDKTCFFFEEGLCSIQNTYGESHLSITCSGYPRKKVEFHEHIEIGLSLSCPEVVRNLISDTSPLEFEFVEPQKINRILLTNYYKDFKTYPNNDIRRYLWDLRAFSIEIMQNRKFTIGQRLMMLGLFSKRLAKINGNSSESLFVIDDLVKLINDEDKANSIFTEELDLYPVTEDLLYSLAAHIEIGLQGVSSHYQNLMKRVASTLELDRDNFDIEKSIAIYNKRYEKLFKPFMEKKSYMIEHVLVSEIYQRLFPIYDNEQDINKSYQNFMMQYYLIQLCLTCSADETAGITDMQFVEDIHSLYRKVEHTKNINDIFNS